MTARLSAVERAEIAAFLAEPTNDIYLRFSSSKSYPQRRGSVERLVAMCKARLHGETINAIAARYELNTERVRHLMRDCCRVGRRRMIARLVGQTNSETPADGKVSMPQ